MPSGIYTRTKEHGISIKKGLIRVGFKPTNYSGDKSSNWQGGKTQLVRKIRGIKEYKQWRFAVISRDKHTCILCGKPGNRADHYPVPFSLLLKCFKIDSIEVARITPMLWKVYNGRTLCKPCDIKYGSCGFYSKVIGEKFIIIKKNKLIEILKGLSDAFKNK